MNFLSIIMAVFSFIGAIDLILGDKFGLGAEFKKGFMFFGDLALSMIGMIVLSPIIGNLLSPILGFVNSIFGIDPSAVTSMIFATDMGGAAVAKVVALNETLGYFNGLVIASMIGCTVSFTIPYALNIVEKEKHSLVLLGFLCGIATIPIGAFPAGLICKIPITTLLINTVPLIIFSGIIILGLLLAPKISVKILGLLGSLIKIIIIIGLCLGLLKFFVGLEPIRGIEDINVGAQICLNSCLALSGIFPFMFILSKLLSKPLMKMACTLKINQIAASSLFTTLAVSMTAFDNIKRMDDKGIVLNSAFSISAAFVLADHLVFTMNFNSDYILPLVIGKITAGILSVVLACLIFDKTRKKETQNAD